MCVCVGIHVCVCVSECVGVFVIFGPESGVYVCGR